MNKALIRNLSLTFESIVGIAGKTIAVQQKYLDSLAKVVLDNKTTLNYLLAEQEAVSVIANTICCTWVNTCREVETQFHKITEQAIWMKKATLLMGFFFDLFNFDWFGVWDHGSKVHSKH